MRTTPTLPLRLENTEPDFPTFMGISALLTGYTKEELFETGMYETYYYTLMKEQDHQTVRAFFEAAEKIVREKGAGIEQELIQPLPNIHPPEQPFKDLARRIILLWYTGVWTTMNGAAKSGSGTPAMLSAESYQQGLIWKTAETHPAGARQPGYASWADIPASVKTRRK